MTLEQFDLPIRTIRKKPIDVRAVQIDKEIQIKTREGTLYAYPGDWILEDIEGNLYPVGNKILGETYDFIEDVYP